MIRKLALFLATATASLEANLALEPYAEIKDGDIDESSGIVKSRQFEDVYWTHNDSGDEARIFAITRNGKSVQTAWALERDAPYEGIAIPDTVNIDWEDIATDDQGNLLIGAFGNNDNARRDLSIYVIPEPDPRKAWTTRARKRIDFHYPDQTQFPNPDRKDFDCESLFFANGKIYLVSKNRSTPEAKLYRLDRSEPFTSNPLTLISEFDLKGQATAADATADGKRLAVLTYTSVWIFDKPDDSDNYFAGQAYYRPIIAKQCEAICWDDEHTLIISNEQQDLFELDTNQIPAFESP